MTLLVVLAGYLTRIVEESFRDCLAGIFYSPDAILMSIFVKAALLHYKAPPKMKPVASISIPGQASNGTCEKMCSLCKFFHRNETFICVFLHYKTMFKSITRNFFLGANIEVVWNFCEPWWGHSTCGYMPADNKAISTCNWASHEHWQLQITILVLLSARCVLSGTGVHCDHMQNIGCRLDPLWLYCGYTQAHSQMRLHRLTTLIGLVPYVVGW